MAGKTVGATHAVAADDLAEKRVTTIVARIALFVVGILILAWMVTALVLASTRGSEKHAAAPGTTVTTMTTSTGTTATGTTPSSGSSTSTTTTTGAKVDESSTSPPSDTVLVALLTFGAILILAGALYTRLSSIKLGSGFEVGLTAEEAQAVADHVAANAKTASPPEVAHATAAALSIARQSKSKADTPTTLSHDEIEKAALTGLDLVGVEAPTTTEGNGS